MMTLMEAFEGVDKKTGDVIIKQGEKSYLQGDTPRHTERETHTKYPAHTQGIHTHTHLHGPGHKESWTLVVECTMPPCIVLSTDHEAHLHGLWVYVYDYWC
jgi:hypothetical protein